MLNRLKSSFKIFKKNNKNINIATTRSMREEVVAATAIKQEPKGIKAKLKQYGKAGVIGYIMAYIPGFFAFYTALHYDYIKVQSIKDVCRDTPVDKLFGVTHKLDQTDPKNIKIITAFLMNEMFDIVRVPLLLLLLKKIVKK
jgi:hypothetical protein